MGSLQKKLRYYCCLFLLLFFLPAYPQINITGRVVDEISNAPLPGTSVYFNNTTIGTYTNQQGNFNFETIRLLNTELVISCAGYEVLIYKPTAEQVERKKVVFKLHKLEPVKNKLVLTEFIRKRCLDIFFKSFLGVSREAEKCTVTNEQSIYFMQGDNNTSFFAYSDTPVVIINNVLGYKISYNLVEFSYDDATGGQDLVGYTHYEELGKDRKYIKARRDCYEGSTLHFYRSLISHRLYEQGFGTFLMQPVAATAEKKLQPRGLIVPGQGI